MAPAHLRKLVVFFAIAAVGWCALLLPTIQRVWDLEATSALVASPTQALVMIPTKRIGWQGSPAARAWNFLMAAAGSWAVPISDERDDLIVYAVDDREVTRTVIAGYGNFSGVVDGQIYAMAGGVFSRWNRGTFAPLAREEKDAVQGRMSREVPEGWTIRGLPLDGDPIEVAFTVKGAAFHLRGRRTDGVKELVLVDQAGRSRTLLSLDTKARFVSRDSYDRDFENQGPRGRR